MDNEKNEFVPVPLPFQIPEPPDLSKVPLSVMHSATVETLISQTEDLMARLKVQIRRNAVLERKALDLEEKTKVIEKEMLTLQHQHELFNEKENKQNEKVKELQTSIDSQKQELALLEVRYSELFSLNQKKEQEASVTVAELEQKIKELERLLPLEKENFAIKDENQFFKQKVEELCTYLQKKEDELKTFKTQVASKSELVANLEGQVKQLTNQAEYNQKAVEEKAELENMLVLKEREKEHKIGHINNELMVTRQELKNLQMMSKGIHTDKIQLESQLRSAETTINTLTKDNAELEKQIENLQNLWYKMQAEFEKEKTKTAALTKLNRELSVELQRSKTTTEDEYLKKYILQGRNVEV